MLVLLLALRATMIEPTDYKVLLKKYQKDINIELNSMDGEYAYICSICDSEVGKNSKHCGACN